MTLTDSKTNEDEIKRYLFAEMSPDERDGFDEKLFLNDELFFDVADLENRLVDAYVRSDLTGDEQARFERGLVLIPSRRGKVANARSLREFIEDERPAEKPVEIESRASVWQQLTSFISGGTPAFATAMAALMVVLVVSIGILLFRNSQKNAEIARLQSDQQRRAELETELESLRQRENELKTTIDNERETSGDISDELERERTHRIEIERELEKTKHENPPPSTSPI
ncbi:MAG TPA: hypothetical protein VHQ01_07680, partial [Pyrinomonadaceae bacterium]|nr:hypothetical protein [Pyrinomonadaceae bacterium]